jgi:ribosomal protein L14
MLQQQSILDTGENTGAKKPMTIRRLGQNTRTAGIGDVIVLAIMQSIPEAMVKKECCASNDCADGGSDCARRRELFTF